jgi:hypothetical protein
MYELLLSEARNALSYLKPLIGFDNRLFGSESPLANFGSQHTTDIQFRLQNFFT